MRKMVEIKNLDYTYPNGSVALIDINLDIFEGESVGIIGPNGAGKTTFLLHLNGILHGCGRISVLDMEMNEKNLKKIRSKVGVVFQDPDDQLFSPTVFDDVSFGPLNMKLPKDAVIKRTKEALTQVEMSEFEDSSPHHLSFGEKKRISLATVLSMNPEILVLDEPSSNLDPKSRRHLMEVLRGIRVTKIISGHDLELILDICNKVVVLDKGKIAAYGGTKEILSNKSLMESHGLEVPLSLR